MFSNKDSDDLMIVRDLLKIEIAQAVPNLGQRIVKILNLHHISKNPS
jgi:hypothetical protein